MTLWKRFVCVIVALMGGPAAPLRRERRSRPSAGSHRARTQPGHEEEANTTAPGSDGRAQDGSAQEPPAPWYAPPGVTLTDPQPPACPEMSHESRAIMSGLECTLENGDLELPPIPRVPEAVLRCLANRDCDFAEVADLISEDPATTTRVLRMANSALWGVQTTSSIPDAVARLGIRPLQSLMLSESLMVAARASRKANARIAMRIWNRALASACIMRGLAPCCRLDPEEAFVMGLLHDLGDVVVLRAIDRYEALSDSAIGDDVFEYLCHRFHQPLGAVVADKWSLDARLKRLIADHHSIPDAADHDREERLLLMLADMINQMIGYGPPAEYHLLNSRPVRELNLAHKPEFMPLLQGLPEQVEQRVARMN